VFYMISWINRDYFPNIINLLVFVVETVNFLWGMNRIVQYYLDVF
jgi:hypothetical protein